MTTIVCNKEEMSGDLQYTFNDQRFKGRSKLFKFGPFPGLCDTDFIVGMAGTASQMMLLAEYFSLGGVTPPPKIKGLTGLVLTAKKEIYLFDDYRVWLRMFDPFASIGSGSSIAKGAMSVAGTSTAEAVKIASKYDVYTGMGVKTLNFK
jgi:ATP-dependent protease HslVU (ClpYQ) peptidase subunit